VDQPARWIRLDPDGVSGLLAVCRGFAKSRDGAASPVCLWGRAAEPARLDDGLWAEAGDFVFALLVPLRHVPGRRDRWLSWGLSPLVAALRRFGAHAYLEGDKVCLHGRRIGGGSVRQIDSSAAILGVFPGEPPRSAGEAERGRLLEFDPWLSALNREGRAKQVLAALRSALEAQHGWQFDTCWPSQAELSAITAEAAQ